MIGTAQSTLFVNGKWQPGEGEMLQSFDPCTGELLWQGRSASAPQVEQAVQSARQAFPHWRDTPFEQRAAALQKFADAIRQQQTELATLISRENGKPLWDAQTEVAAMIGKIALSIQAWQQRTGESQKNTTQGELHLRHKPHGVVAVFGPFNFPAHLPNGHIVPALLAGNSVLFKPSELTPAVADFTLRCWQAAGLPAGVLTLLQGSRETGAALMQQPQLDGIFFTGSAQTGHYLHQQWGGQPHKILALEMGGNNPLIVEPVRDINAALFTVIFSAFVSSGQRCTCARRLLLPDSSWGDDFLRALQRRCAELPVANGLQQPPPFMGALISADAARHLQEGLCLLESLGGKILLSSRLLNPQQTLMTPALVDMSTAVQTFDEELFGPVLQVFRYRDRAHAVEQANATRFGLAAGVISDDSACFDFYYRHLRAGLINFNKPLTGASSEAPFGGIGASGNHRPSAFYAADYCAYPVATLRSAAVQLPATLPPGWPSGID